jgi:predicted dehydrogenase
VELHRDGNRVTIERFPRVNQYVAQVEAFAATVRTGAAYAVPLEFSRGTQTMIDRAQNSAQHITL